MIHNVHSQETATTQITTSQTNGKCSYVVLKMSGWEKRMTSSYQKLVQSHLPKIGYSCYQHWWKSQHLDCKSIGRKQCWENTHSIKDIFIFLSAGLKKMSVVSDWIIPNRYLNFTSEYHAHQSVSWCHLPIHSNLIELTFHVCVREHWLKSCEYKIWGGWIWIRPSLAVMENQQRIVTL